MPSSAMESALASARDECFDGFQTKVEYHFLWLTELQQQLEKESVEAPERHVNFHLIVVC